MTFVLTSLAIGLAAYLAYQIGLLMVAFILLFAMLHESNRGD